MKALTLAGRALSATTPFTIRAGIMTATLPLSFGAAAGVAALAGSHLLQRTLGGGRDEGMFAANPHGAFGPRTPMFSAGAQRAVSNRAMGIGAARGVHQAAGGGWSVEQAIATGTLEVERPNFLGATGSLTLATHRLRHGRVPRQLMPDDESGMTASHLAYGAAHVVF